MNKINQAVNALKSIYEDKNISGVYVSSDYLLKVIDDLEDVSQVYLRENDRYYPFDEGDTYYTIEDGQIVESVWDSISEEIYDEDKNILHFHTYKSAYSFLSMEKKEN